MTEGAKEERWTPGPWTDLGPSDFRGKLIVGASRPAPEGMDASDGLIHTAVAEALDGADTPLEANARLIAAAPEMAELLAQLAHTREWSLELLQDEARALLQRIKGEQ